MADLTDKLERLDIINKPGEVTAAEAVDVVMPRTRFQVGDRVECFCGDAGYLPATVAGLCAAAQPSWFYATAPQRPTGAAPVGRVVY